MNMQLLIKKVTIISPTSKYHLKKKDILINNGIIDKIADSIVEKNAKVIEGKGMYVSVGWMDLFSDFCDPGHEQKETCITGSKAATAGGYTDVCLIPNTNPSNSSKSTVEYLKNNSTIVNLHPIGSISKNIEGKDLAEMYDMRLSGAIAFSDGKKPVQQSGLLLKALEYIKTFDGMIIEIPEDYSIAQNGQMHEGEMSTRLGMQGKASIAESIHLQRNIELLQYTQSKLHVTGVSTQKGIELIRQAKKKGLNITCSVTPHHLLLTDNQLKTYDSLYKTTPPLRTETDRKALVKGILDGTIDCIATHHTPQDWDAKQVEFEYAKEGMIGLQTAFSLLLSVDENIPLETWIHLLTDAPREILQIDKPEIAEKSKACLTLFNTHEKWNFDATTNQSKSTNSPYFGQTLTGKVIGIVNNNQWHFNE